MRLSLTPRLRFPRGGGPHADRAFPARPSSSMLSPDALDSDNLPLQALDLARARYRGGPGRRRAVRAAVRRLCATARPRPCLVDVGNADMERARQLTGISARREDTGGGGEARGFDLEQLQRRVLFGASPLAVATPLTDLRRVRRQAGQGGATGRGPLDDRRPSLLLCSAPFTRFSSRLLRRPLQPLQSLLASPSLCPAACLTGTRAGRVGQLTDPLPPSPPRLAPSSFARSASPRSCSLRRLSQTTLATPYLALWASLSIRSAPVERVVVEPH